MVTEPFFPSTCHAALSRRHFLVFGAVAASVATAKPAKAREGDDVIHRHATTPRDPWAVAHGVRAMGRDFRIEGGRRAVDFLLEDHITTVTVNGRTMLAFPRAVEIHPNMFLKTLLEAGVPLEYSFAHGGQRRTLADLVNDARLLLKPDDETVPPTELAWTIIALTRTTSPLRQRWTNAWGQPVDLDAAVGRALEALEQASAPLAEAMRGKRAPSRAPVHSLTCGGTHVIYSLVVALHAGYGGKDRARRVREQLDVLVWRLGTEPHQIDRFYAARRPSPLHWWLPVGAKLKLLGHAEECLALAAQSKVAAFSAAQQAQRQTAISELRRLLAEVETRDDLSKLRVASFEAHQQIVGDVCHARHGLTLS